MAALENALEMYGLDVGRYPTTAEGLDALRKPPADAPANGKWKGPYLTKPAPSDPWGHPYRYAAPGTHRARSFDLWSAGPDGVNGTTDDIANW